MLKLLPYAFSPTKLVSTPLYLIHFVTNRCNAKCPHCFVYDSEGEPVISGDEMSLDEIDIMTRSMGSSLYNVNLTGGETFLRKDIEDICELYLNNTKTQVLQLFTNGYLQDRILTTVENICQKYPSRNIVVVTSIDDLHEKHDSYRKLKNGFAKAMDTYEQLRAMGFANLDLDIGLTVNHKNQDNLENIYDYLVKDKKIRTLSCSIVRGNPSDPDSKEVDLERYKKFSEKINHGMQNGELDCFNGFPGADLLNAKSVYMRKKSIPDKIEKGYESPCYAGRLIGVIYANGEVYPCELLEKPIGNLKDFDFSFPKIWASPKAKKIRDWIWDSKCYCEHECFQTINILFNPRYYPEILKEYARIKIGKFK